MKIKMEFKEKVSPNGKDFLKAVKNIKTTSSKVGWWGKYPDEKGNPGPYVGEVALKNELGVPSQNIPSRPFLRPTIDSESEKWISTLEKMMELVIQDKMTIEDAMSILAETAKGDIQKKISSIWSPPLSPYTIQKRLEKRGLNSKSIKSGSLLNKPLIDTGILFNTLTTKVETK